MIKIFKHHRWAFLFINFVFCVNVLVSSVSDISVGAKYISLGGLGATNTDDVYGTYYNPAMLDLIDKHQIAAEYTGMFLGLSENISHTFFSYAIPSKNYGSYGIYYKNFSASSYYSENIFALVYGKKGILKSLDRIDLGLRFKGIYLVYKPEDGVYTDEGIFVDQKDSIFSQTNSKVVFSIDFGLNYNLADNYRLGLLINDILEPNVSLINTEGVVIPRKIVFGVSNINTSYGLNLDFGIKEKDFIAVFGVQKKFNVPLKLFSSIKLTSRNYSYRTITLLEPSLGMEYNFDGISVSYAFNYPISGIDTFGNHTVSFLYRFGKVVKFKEDTIKLKETIDDLSQKIKEKDLEIEELRKKLDELLKQPPKLSTKQVKADVTKEIPKIVLDSQTPQQKYDSLLNAYFDRKEKISFMDKMKVLETIIKQFKGSLDISRAQKEYDELLKEKDAMTREYEQSKSYYLRLKSRGAGITELLGVLNRMIDKYVLYGIDISWAKDEKEKILR